MLDDEDKILFKDKYGNDYHYNLFIKGVHDNTRINPNHLNVVKMTDEINYKGELSPIFGLELKSEYSPMYRAKPENLFQNNVDYLIELRNIIEHNNLNVVEKTVMLKGDPKIIVSCIEVPDSLKW